MVTKVIVVSINCWLKVQILPDPLLFHGDKMYNIHPNTFGNCQASANLADILNKLGDSRQISKVSNILERQNRHINAIEIVEDAHTKKELLYRIHRTALIDYKIDILDKKVRTHLLCILKTKYKTALKRIKS